MINRKQLTPKQQEVLHYIKTYVRSSSNWPTYGDLVDEFGFRSPNSVTQNLQALVKKGYLVRDGNGYHFPHQELEIPLASRGIPVSGIITAGALQEAVGEDLGDLTLEDLFPKLERMFALRVKGNSMIEAGILDGDYVLLSQETDLPNGAIGAVMIDGETTLKRVFRESTGLRLEPANHELEDIIVDKQRFEFEDVQIIGRYIGRIGKDGAMMTMGGS
ncbi:MAG TPA: transcriptional repressor LexA [Rhodothermales bacterium]|nr:transcriptional repressor LexA [Rhodothermales bacterium]HRR08362.1 transcriptional repressor LexA [Rhodothermales bacterium]